MNRKASFIFLFFYVFLMFIAVIGIVIHENPNADIEKVKGNLTWKEQVNPNNSSTILVVTYSFVNWMGASAFEVAKAGIDFSKRNPNIPWKLIFWGVVLAIILPIFLSLAKIILITFIFIKEAIVSYRERKQIRHLKSKIEK